MLQVHGFPKYHRGILKQQRNKGTTSALLTVITAIKKQQESIPELQRAGTNAKLSQSMQYDRKSQLQQKEGKRATLPGSVRRERKRF